MWTSQKAPLMQSNWSVSRSVKCWFTQKTIKRGTADKQCCLPPVELLHLLDRTRPAQAIRRGCGRGPLPCGGPVNVIHVENTTVAVDTGLPVWAWQTKHKHTFDAQVDILVCQAKIFKYLILSIEVWLLKCFFLYFNFN